MAASVETVLDVAEDEPVVVCLNVLRSAGSLLARHKAELAKLLLERGPNAKLALQRLVADASEVLAQAEKAQQQQEGGAEQDASESSAAMSGSSPAPKRPKGQGGATQPGRPPQQQGGAAAPPLVQERLNPLAVVEVVEHVMSFVEGRELLGRLSVVCRLWRSVAQRESLCLPLVQRIVPVAMRGGASSLHRQLGGSAWRCLLAHKAGLSSDRLLMPNLSAVPRRSALKLLVEIFHGDKPLWATCPDMYVNPIEDALAIYAGWDEGFQEQFSGQMLGIHGSMHSLFTGGHLRVRLGVMDMRTGVTASLFDATFRHRYPLPALDEGDFNYCMTVPVTSMTYDGPPLQAQVILSICPQWNFEDGELQSLDQQTQRFWGFAANPTFHLTGQSPIYAEKFIRCRLAEEMAAAKQHDRPWFCKVW